MCRIQVIGNTPLSDPSGMCVRVVRPEPSPAVLLSGLKAGISEVSRFSCTKLLGVSGVYDFAGLNWDSRYCPGPYSLPSTTKASAS